MIADSIYRWARRFPDRTALIHNGTTIGYAAFARAIDASRRFFAAQNLPIGRTAVVVADNLRDAWFVVLGLRAVGLDTICAQRVDQIDGLGLRNPGCVVVGEEEIGRAHV